MESDKVLKLRRKKMPPKVKFSKLEEGKFTVDLRCPECGEHAAYGFDVEESRDEYLVLWRDWHAEPATCAACPFLSKAKRKKCTVCGGIGTVWPYRHDGHKRSLIPLPNPKRKVKINPETMPPLCEVPQLDWKRA